MMNTKEQLRLKEFRNYVDFLDNSQDIQDHGRFIDTLQALYEDGWFDWIYLYAKEQTERVQELEMTVDFYQSTLRDADRRVQELEEEVERYQSGRNVAVITKMKMDVTQERNERLEKRVQKLENRIADDEHFVVEILEQNNRYRKAIERALDESGWGDEGNALNKIIGILNKALEGEK